MFIERIQLVDITLVYIETCFTIAFISYELLIRKFLSFKGVLVALWFGYLESWNGAETSLGTFLDPIKTFYAKTKFSIFYVS